MFLILYCCFPDDVLAVVQYGFARKVFIAFFSVVGFFSLILSFY